MKITHEEFKTKAKEVIDTCNKYGFMDKTIMPYSFKMTVGELVRNWKDYDHCTWSSKELMQDELIGFLPILENWVNLENEPKVTVRLKNGVVKTVAKSVAEDLVDFGIATIVTA